MTAGALSLFLAGDVMLGRGIDQILARPSDPRLHEGWVTSAEGYVRLAEERHGALPRRVGPAYVWGDLLAELDARAPDLRIVNLETAITTSDAYEPKGINYRMRPANAGVLRAARIDACLLANNHVLDWGAAGLVETLGTLDALGIAYAGAGRDAAGAAAPLILPAPQGRLILAAFGCPTSGIPPHWQAGPGRPGVALLPGGDDAALAAVTRAAEGRRPGDILAVSNHWGSNWGHEIPPRQRRLARRLIDEAGADLVFGHSSHHPKAVEFHQGKPIVYGSGDLLNDYEGIGGREEFRAHLALAWFAAFDAAGALVSLEMVPFRIERFRLTRATEEEAAWLAATLSRESARRGTAITRSPAGAFRAAPA
ncbi:MAG: CapA family protein, partial [Paracoccaceae bacterium]|nr:CapA family protein [Paracoccaceae bacterium]